jgi:hypothetical protein
MNSNTNNIILDNPKKRSKSKHLIYSGEWKDGLPYISENYFLDFSQFDNFSFNNIFQTKKSLRFSQKGFYFGEINEDLEIHGKGSFFYKNQFFYKGYFERGLWHNKGEVNFKLRRIYKGEFYEGQLQGMGHLYKENGNIFMGHFYSGKLQGAGKILMNNGCLFVGNFYDNKREGKGKTVFPDKSVLEGKYEKGKLEGIATLSKIDLNGKIIFFKRKYKNGKLKSEVIVNKKPSQKDVCCLKFTF